MATKASSPTAHILRNSRLFSLPRPLPSPPVSSAADSMHTIPSETATLPYPIQQTISSPPGSIGIGDWGLKRNFPLRSTTKTNNPVLRINALDTREYITDFSSAQDHVMTLQKVQELNLPVTSSKHRFEVVGPDRRISAFEPRFDNTDPSSTVRSSDVLKVDMTRDELPNRRWKYEGPWVGGMKPGEFEEYLEKELKPRKKEFGEFLRERSRQQIISDRKRDARADLTDANETVTEEELAEHIQKLRREYDLDSNLARLIMEFLDLPEMYRSRSDFVDSFKSMNQGPPIIHPSAGLSYLKSDAFLDNHPLFGPQTDRKPVQGRVLRGITRFEHKANQGRLGVAGVITNAPSAASARISATPEAIQNQGALRPNHGIGLDRPGGNRIWLLPTKLEVDAQGKLRMEASNPTQTVVGIHTGDLTQSESPKARSRARSDANSPTSMPKLDPIVSGREFKTGRPTNIYNVRPGDNADNTSMLMQQVTDALFSSKRRQQNNKRDS